MLIPFGSDGSPLLAQFGIAAFVHDKRGNGDSGEINLVAEEIIGSGAGI